MSIFNKITRGRIKKPLFCALYSGPGVGKTLMGASFPSPLFFDFEESTHNIDVERIDSLTAFSAVMDGLNEILDLSPGSLSFKSIIFDTIDELERLIHVQVADDEKKASIDKIGWQKGYGYAINYWYKLISVCRQIRDKHNINFLFLAHATQRGAGDIEAKATYTRYAMSLHSKAADFIFGQVEMVLFAKKKISFTKDSEGNSHAKDHEERILCTSLSAHYDAKNRIGLPLEMPMPIKNGYQVLWAAYEKAFNDTALTVFNECLDLMKRVESAETVLKIKEYIEKHKTDIAVMRASLNQIKTIIKGQK